MRDEFDEVDVDVNDVIEISTITRSHSKATNPTEWLQSLATNLQKNRSGALNQLAAIPCDISFVSIMKVLPIWPELAHAVIDNKYANAKNPPDELFTEHTYSAIYAASLAMGNEELAVKVRSKARADYTLIYLSTDPGVSPQIIAKLKSKTRTPLVAIVCSALDAAHGQVQDLWLSDMLSSVNDVSKVAASLVEHKNFGAIGILPTAKGSEIKNTKQVVQQLDKLTEDELLLALKQLIKISGFVVTSDFVKKNLLLQNKELFALHIRTPNFSPIFTVQEVVDAFGVAVAQKYLIRDEYKDNHVGRLASLLRAAVNSPDCTEQQVHGLLVAISKCGVDVDAVISEVTSRTNTPEDLKKFLRAIGHTSNPSRLRDVVNSTSECVAAVLDVGEFADHDILQAIHEAIGLHRAQRTTANFDNNIVILLDRVGHLPSQDRLYLMRHGSPAVLEHLQQNLLFNSADKMVLRARADYVKLRAQFFPGDESSAADSMLQGSQLVFNSEARSLIAIDTMRASANNYFSALVKSLQQLSNLRHFFSAREQQGGWLLDTNAVMAAFRADLLVKAASQAPHLAETIASKMVKLCEGQSDEIDDWFTKEDKTGVLKEYFSTLKTPTGLLNIFVDKRFGDEPWQLQAMALFYLQYRDNDKFYSQLQEFLRTGPAKRGDSRTIFEEFALKYNDTAKPKQSKQLADAVARVAIDNIAAKVQSGEVKALQMYNWWREYHEYLVGKRELNALCKGARTEVFRVIKLLLDAQVQILEQHKDLLENQQHFVQAVIRLASPNFMISLHQALSKKRTSTPITFELQEVPADEQDETTPSPKKAQVAVPG